MLRKGQFTINDETAYEGYTHGETWSGWECPMFTREEGERIASEFDTSADLLSYNEGEDCFEWEDDDDLNRYEAIETEVGTLYPIGAGEWIWSEVIG
jgi:hypothetical protein